MYKTLLFLLLVLCSNTYGDYTIVNNECSLQILTPYAKNQEMAKIICNNGLQLLIISNPDLPSYGASLIIGTGNTSDPNKVPGLAHFTEHCVFLGNHMYPKTSSFSEFLGNNGGMYNAFTYPHKTTYIFSIEKNSFSAALHQFAHLFINPLFRQEDIDKEKHAIQQEFVAHPISDARRVFRIRSLTLPDNHPAKRFGCGNLDSLSLANSHTLSSWFHKHYAPQNMKAIIYTPHPLQEAVRDISSLFNQIPDKPFKPSASKYKFKPHTYSTPLLYINPAVQSKKILSIFWELPQDLLHLKETFSALSTLISYESEGSLTSHLKQQLLISNCEVGYFNTSNSTGDFLVRFELTEEGEQNLSYITNQLHEYLLLISKLGIPQYCTDEISTMNTLDYIYSSKTSLFHLLHEQSEDFYTEPLSSYPEKSLIPLKDNYHSKKKLLTLLTKTSHPVYILSSNNANLIKNSEQYYDPIYDMHYYLVKDIIVKVETTERSLQLPSPNPFIPQVSFIIPQDIASYNDTFPFKPVLDFSSKHITLYTCPDTYYLTPKVSLQLQIKCPIISATKVNSLVLTDLYCTSLKNQLDSICYPATLAGVEYHVFQHSEGINITVSCYEDTLPIIIKVILKAIQEIQTTSQQYLNYKEQIFHYYNDLLNQCPIKAGLDVLLHNETTNHISLESKISSLKSLSFSDYQYFEDTMFSQIHLNCMLLGNLSNQNQKDLLQQLTLFSSKFEAKPITIPYRLQFKDRSSSQIHNLQFSLPINGLIMILKDQTSNSYEDKICIQLFMQWFHNIFFEEIRTKQQLGYLVGAVYKEYGNIPCGVLYIRSDNYTPQELSLRVQNLIKQVLTDPSKYGLDIDTFNQLKSSLIAKLKQPEMDLQSMTTSLFSLAFEHENNKLTLPNEKILALKNLSFDTFQNHCSLFLNEKLGTLSTIHINGNFPSSTRSK